MGKVIGTINHRRQMKWGNGLGMLRRLRSTFLLSLLFTIVLMTSGCFFDYSVVKIGKITYETYENSPLKIKKLDFEKTPLLAEPTYQIFYDRETFYLKATGYGGECSRLESLLFKIDPNYRVVSVKSLPRRVRAVEAVALSTYDEFYKKCSFHWNRYHCCLSTTSNGCQDTADTRIAIQENRFKKLIYLYNLGNTTVFICDINHDGLKDLLMINQYNCQGIDEMYFIEYPRVMNSKHME